MICKVAFVILSLILLLLINNRVLEGLQIIQGDNAGDSARVDPKFPDMPNEQTSCTVGRIDQNLVIRVADPDNMFGERRGPRARPDIMATCLISDTVEGTTIIKIPYEDLMRRRNIASSEKPSGTLLANNAVSSNNANTQPAPSNGTNGQAQPNGQSNGQSLTP